FYFSCYAPPRHPHSFPTRRSSDLKVAFQFFALPTQLENGALQVAVSNPFDTAMLNAVQFDAQCPVQFGLAPRVEIEKALKKYYGDRKSTRLNSSHDQISYAVFCLK